MAKTDSITPEILRQLLRYEPETGKLFWLSRGPEMFRDGPCGPALKARKWNAWRAGKPAFGISGSTGYLTGTVLFKKVAAHRVAWAMYYGRWPSDQIDHINHNRADNRICNLREVTDAENKRNTKRRADNKSGITGIYWSEPHSKWRAQIRREGKRYHIGLYETKRAAAAARKRAEKLLDFHENHGRVA